MSDPDPCTVDPALGVASDQAAGRALAVQAAALVFVWKDALGGHWLSGFTVHGTVHGLVVIGAAAVAIALSA